MARKIKFTGLLDINRKFHKRRQIKKDKVSADDVFKYIDLGIKFASSPLVSSIVQASAGALQPSEEDIIAAQLEEGKGVTLKQQMERLGAEKLPADPRQAAAAAQLEETVLEDLALQGLREDIAAEQGAALLRRGAQLQQPSILGPEQAAPTRMAPSPTPGVVSPEPVPVTEMQYAPYESPMVAEGAFRPVSTRQAEETLAAAELTPDMQSKLTEISQAIEADPKSGVMQAFNILREIEQVKPTLDAAGQQTLDDFGLKVKDILGKKWPPYSIVPFERKEIPVGMPKAVEAPTVEELLKKPIEDLTNEEFDILMQQGGPITPEKQRKWLEEQLRKVSPTEVPVPTGQAPFVEVPGARMAATQAVPLPTPPTALGRGKISLSPGELQLGLPEAVKAAEPTPVEPAAAVTPPSFVDEKGQLDPKRIASAALSAQGDEILRQAGVADDQLKKFQELAKIVATPVPEFEELYPMAAAAPKEVLPAVLPGTWEGLYTLAPHVTSLKEQQRLLAHAKKHLGGRARNIWEAIASIGGDTPEKTARLQTLIKQFPKKRTGYDVWKERKKEIDVATSKLKYRQLIEKNQRDRVKAEAKLIKDFEGIREQQARTAKGVAASAKAMRKMLRAAPAGARSSMKQNNAGPLLKNLQKQSNDAYKRSNKELTSIKDNMSKLDAAAEKLADLTDRYENQIAEKQAQRATLNTKKPSEMKRGRSNPAYVTWRQKMARLEADITKLQQDHTKASSKAEEVETRIKNLSYDQVAKKQEADTYQSYANEASDILGVRNKSDQHTQAKDLLRRIEGR